MIEECCDHNERNGITEGEPATTAVPTKNRFGFLPDSGAVIDNCEVGFDFFKKSQGGRVIFPIA